MCTKRELDEKENSAAKVEPVVSRYVYVPHEGKKYSICYSDAGFGGNAGGCLTSVGAVHDG